MRPRLLFATSLFTSLAACGAGGSTDIDPTLVLAERSDLEINRLVAAASGSEGFQAQGQLGQFDEPFEPDPCPVVVEDVDRVTITGGCTRADGMAVEGSATITNPLGWGELDYDFTEDSIYEYAGFALVFEGGTRMGYDGVFRIAPSYDELDMDLVVDSFGATLRSDLFMDCDMSGCELGESGLELVGVGGVRVSGSIGVGGQQVDGDLTIRGADTSVKVTIANNCVAWRLEGTDRAKTCP